MGKEIHGKLNEWMNESEKRRMDEITKKNIKSVKE